MSIIPLLSKELDQEASSLRKMLQLVPADKFDYKPHEKSMSMKQLTVHLAELPGWIQMVLTTSELDFATMPYDPTPAENSDDLVRLMDESLKKSKEQLEKSTDADLEPKWTLRNGEQIYSTYTKYEIIRHALAQIIHHRAQLGVYLRLLNIPLPAIYGPSADDMSF